MAALNLFPSRVRFVNEDGTLTIQAFRALQIVSARVGGALGDSGIDVFGQVFGIGNDTNNLSILQIDTVQPVNFGSDYYGSMTYPDVTQSISKESGNFTTLDVSKDASIGGRITTLGGTAFIATNTTLTDGAGVGAGTLLTAPVAGNPTKWIGINDNGITRYIPAW